MGYIKRRFNPEEIDLSSYLTPAIKLKHPIISANMDTITGKSMLLEMNRLGGLGVHYRQCDVLLQIEALNSLPLDAPKIACIGVGEKEFERLKLILRCAPYITATLIDVAHGHSEQVIGQIKNIKSLDSSMSVIAGNVATVEGTRTLIEAGADCIKVGIGPGSLCTTRLMTGNGVPQLTAIMNAVKGRNLSRRAKHISIIADGGIRYPADCVKSFAAGADAVMIGSLFAGTDETPGEIIYSVEGNKKLYRGSASFSAQNEWKGKAKGVEGEEALVPATGPVSNVFQKLIDGILSGMSYQGAHNLLELQEHATFCVQTFSGIIEAMPHRKLTTQ